MQTNLLFDDLFRLVHGLKQQILAELNRRGVEVAPVQVRSLKWLSMHEGKTANDLASAFQRDKAQITRLVQGLIAEGWVQKQPNPQDGRSQLLSLTANGRALVEQLNEVEKVFTQRLELVLGEDQFALYKSQTRQLFEAMN